MSQSWLDERLTNAVQTLHGNMNIWQEILQFSSIAVPKVCMKICQLLKTYLVAIAILWEWHFSRLDQSAMTLSSVLVWAISNLSQMLSSREFVKPRSHSSVMISGARLNWDKFTQAEPRSYEEVGWMMPNTSTPTPYLHSPWNCDIFLPDANMHF